MILLPDFFFLKFHKSGYQEVKVFIIKVRGDFIIVTFEVDDIIYYDI